MKYYAKYINQLSFPRLTFSRSPVPLSPRYRCWVLIFKMLVFLLIRHQFTEREKIRDCRLIDFRNEGLERRNKYTYIYFYIEN